MNDLIYIIFCGLFLGVLSAITIFCFAMGVKQYKKQKECKIKEPNVKEDKNMEQEFKRVEVNATVMEQSCSVKMIGIKSPKTVKEFIIVFKTNDGKFLKLPVPEEMYDGFEKGQNGILTMIDDELYSFVLNEDL